MFQLYYLRNVTKTMLYSAIIFKYIKFTYTFLQGPSRETISLKEKLKRKMQAQLSRQREFHISRLRITRVTNAICHDH